MTEILAEVTTPGTVETRLGMLTFDGSPDHATMDKVYGNLEFQRKSAGLPAMIERPATRRRCANQSAINDDRP